MNPLHDADLEKVYLKPGELYIGEGPTKVITVLGSCVSVTLFSRRLSDWGHMSWDHAALQKGGEMSGCMRGRL